MSHALMIFYIAFILMLRIHNNVAVGQYAIDTWQDRDSIEPDILQSALPSSSDESNLRESSNLMRGSNGLVKRVPNGFNGVRGKKNLLSNEIDEMQENNNNNGLNYLFNIFRENNEVPHIKKVNYPAMQRFYWQSKRYEDEVEKRALKNAFMGVRGKKDADHSFYKRAIYNDQEEDRKRFEQFTNKFVAVRGKKLKMDGKRSLQNMRRMEEDSGKGSDTLGQQQKL